MFSTLLLRITYFPVALLPLCPQVRERDLPMVMHTLSSEFTLLRVVNGETVAANSLGVTNGFVKPKLGKRRRTHRDSADVGGADLDGEL